MFSSSHSQCGIGTWRAFMRTCEAFGGGAEAMGWAGYLMADGRWSIHPLAALANRDLQRY
jgi:hypothetical protein